MVHILTLISKGISSHGFKGFEVAQPSGCWRSSLASWKRALPKDTPWVGASFARIIYSHGFTPMATKMSLRWSCN